MVNAIRHLWPETRIYACTSHLVTNVETILKKYRLYDRTTQIVKTLHRSTFTQPKAYLAFRQEAARRIATPPADAKQSEGLRKLGGWIADNEAHIAQNLAEKHWPVTVGSLEQPLRRIKNSIHDRRHSLRSLDRLQSLLLLMQLEQMGLADEREWARLLRQAHEARAAGASTADGRASLLGSTRAAA